MTKVTRVELEKKKRAQKPIVVVTAYDFTSARMVDQSGADAILVGDSLGMVIQGRDSTLPVTLDQMVYHTQCVTRAKPQAHVVADLPFGTFQRGADQALDASIRLVQEASAEAVKIEGAKDRLAAIEKVAKADIPVWGHIGLTPQSVHAFGGFRIQGKDDEGARRLVEQAVAVQEAGAFMLVLECIPWDVAQLITQTVTIPTIGIGAGPHCDGQVLVFHDLLGFFDDFTPKFVKRYAEAKGTLESALRQFGDEVRGRQFPTMDHSYGATPKTRTAKEE